MRRLRGGQWKRDRVQVSAVSSSRSRLVVFSFLSWRLRNALLVRRNKWPAQVVVACGIHTHKQSWLTSCWPLFYKPHSLAAAAVDIIITQVNWERLPFISTWVSAKHKKFSCLLVSSFVCMIKLSSCEKHLSPKAKFAFGAGALKVNLKKPTFIHSFIKSNRIFYF